jgi:hypothetical protein
MKKCLGDDIPTPILDVMLRSCEVSITSNVPEDGVSETAFLQHWHKWVSSKTSLVSKRNSVNKTMMNVAMDVDH